MGKGNFRERKEKKKPKKVVAKYVQAREHN